jgi:abortive infection bacteriophage resistance protein
VKPETVLESLLLRAWTPVFLKGAVAMTKHVASVAQQIATMEMHGISFDHMSKSDAEFFLQNSTYFFKIKAYENNYEKRCDGDTYKYANLDFAYLVELSTVDLALSRLIWSMCSRIEHALKVRFNQLLMKYPDKDFENRCVTRCYGTAGVSFDHNSPYTAELKEQYKGSYPVWSLWELTDFGTQLDLYGHFLNQAGIQDPMVHFLSTVRLARNAVSHGNCLLADIDRLTPKVEKRVEEDGRRKGDKDLLHYALIMCDKSTKRKGSRENAFRKSLNWLIVNNLSAVLICALNIIDSPKMLEHCVEETEQFLERLERHHAEYYGNTDGIVKNHSVDIGFNSFKTLCKGFKRKVNTKLQNNPNEENCVGDESNKMRKIDLFERPSLL